MASYERLADSAFAAAMDIQRYLLDKSSSFQEYREFVNLLEEPLVSNESYKLLYDARNLPLYKAAWSNVFGQAATELKADLFLKRVSDLLNNTLQNIENGEPIKAADVIKFCLSLNQIFLEENARRYAANYQARIRNAAP